MTLRVYHLFPDGPRGMSCETEHYHGRSIDVVATSVRQAFALAYNDVWSTDPGHGVGIVETYDRARGRTLYCCGFVAHGASIALGHYKGVRHVREQVASHRARHHAAEDDVQAELEKWFAMLANTAGAGR